MKNLAADLLNLQWCFGVLGASVHQVDGCLVPRFPFGDGQRFCRWIFKATDQGWHQLLRGLSLLGIGLAMHQGNQVALKLLKPRWLNFELIGCFPAFHHQWPARLPMALEPGRLVDHHCCQPSSSGKFEIDIDQASVASHQARPRHGDARALKAPWTSDGSRGRARVRGAASR